MGNIPYEAPKAYPSDDLVGGVVTVGDHAVMVDKKIAQGEHVHHLCRPCGVPCEARLVVPAGCGGGPCVWDRTPPSHACCTLCRFRVRWRRSHAFPSSCCCAARVCQAGTASCTLRMTPQHTRRWC